jgi:hypothetical protein
MRPRKDMEQIIRTKLNLVFDPPRRDQLLTRALHEQEQSWEMEPTREEPALRRMIMKSPIVKLGIAAAVLAVVGVGIMEFIGTGSQSGALWAQAVKNVEASQGVIWRLRGTGSRDPNDDWPNGYKITWRSPTITRVDNYRNGQIYRMLYYNLDAKTVIWVAHDAKKYNKEAMSEERVQRVRADKERWSDPQGLLNLALSLEHRALGQKTIDGVLCDGIEATGPDGLTGRLWVGVETGYPVLIEVEAMRGGIRCTSTLDQFRWNVDLSAEGVEPEIPAGYDPL